MNDLNDEIFILPLNDQLVIVYNEFIKPNVSQISNYFDRVEKLSKGQKFHLIINLSNSEIPSISARNHIKLRLNSLAHLTLSHNVYVGTNILIKVAVKFIGMAIGINFKVCNSIEDAYQKISRIES